MRSSVIYHHPIWFRFLGMTFHTLRRQGICLRCMLRVPGKQSFITTLNLGKGGTCDHTTPYPRMKVPTRKGRYIWLAA